jgi:predicted GNAT superfamily acetyltransferase
MPSDAWERANQAAASAGVTLGALTSLEDAESVVHVMRETWGDHDLMPREMLRALAESGNVPWGAFDGEDIVGYVLGWAGVDPDDGIHVHSHMLATLPSRRHAGVGYALKLAQRAMSLDQGINLVRWTFDPLIARNAHFNVTKLGAHCDRFNRNFYGEMGDTLNAGDRSDRLVVRWDLDREPGPWPFPTGEGVVVVRAAGPADLPRPERSEEAMFEASADGEGCVRLGIPRDYANLRRVDPGLGQEWRDATGEILVECFALGLRVVAFDADLEGGYPVYGLATPEAALDWPEDVA